MEPPKPSRHDRLMPNGMPKYVRCYDNGGKSIDRYTVVFTQTSKFDPMLRGGCVYLSMSAAPFHPQGFGQHGESHTIIDRPTYGHLGKRISFQELPEDCQRLVLTDYQAFWGIG